VLLVVFLAMFGTRHLLEPGSTLTVGGSVLMLESDAGNWFVKSRCSLNHGKGKSHEIPGKWRI